MVYQTGREDLPDTSGYVTGFKKDDVIVEVDGRSGRMSEGQLMGYLLEKHRPGEKVQTAVLRGSDRVVLALPMQ